MALWISLSHEFWHSEHQQQDYLNNLANHPTPAARLSRSPAEVRTSPCLGEHTEYVCTSLLGMNDAGLIGDYTAIPESQLSDSVKQT